MSCDDQPHDEPEEAVFLIFATTEEILKELKRRGNHVVLILDKPATHEQPDQFSCFFSGGACQSLGMVERGKDTILGWMDAQASDDEEDEESYLTD